ncbi:hypothetical protein IWZ03DRAFT_17090 [Phyllosticta citriasiana]|uniref:Uncharacterized protein n=1 Tax=Phyllosticta citriasiana TaxID=595635 RepID=A0ABR1L0F5_9PEZI
MRRYMARSDEEVDENIEDDSHRVGWPQLRPLPRTFVKIEDLASFVSDSHRIFDVLGSVLTSQSVEFSGMEFGHMGTRGGSEPPLPTLLVAAGNKSSSRTSWHLAVLRLVRKIQALVISNDDFGVEIVEELFPLYRPIEAGDPMIPIWENQIAPKVMEIQEGKSLFWQCLSLVRLGGSHTPEPNDQNFAAVRSKDGIVTVVKLGRMSGWTRGKRNFASAFWKEPRQEDPEVGGSHDSYGVVTSCIRIEPYSESDGTKSLNPSKSAQSGDSGSVVRDEKTGTWLGLLFGAHPQDGWALMTPIDIIFESIEDVTGGRVVDPMPLE